MDEYSYEQNVAYNEILPGGSLHETCMKFVKENESEMINNLLAEHLRYVNYENIKPLEAQGLTSSFVHKLVHNAISTIDWYLVATDFISRYHLYYKGE